MRIALMMSSVHMLHLFPNGRAGVIRLNNLSNVTIMRTWLWFVWSSLSTIIAWRQ